MKILKVIAIFLICLLLIGGGVFLFFNEKEPIGENPARAEELAEKMSVSLHKAAWDSTAAVSWTFAGSHHYVWDRKNDFVEIIWDENRVLLNLKDWPKGKAYEDNKEIKDEQLDVLRGKAWSFFCNDSYWLIAPYKVFDEGVSRKIVKTPDNKEALLVSYSSGGVTPGDTYLWHLDENGMPTSYQMWVKIIPIGGVSATWENWTETATGAILATKHQMGPMDILIENLQTGNRLTDIGVSEDLFDVIH